MYRHARTIFVEKFAHKPLTPAEAQIIEESQAQIRLAESDLNDIDQVDIGGVKAHLLCLILLNTSVRYVEQLSRQNLIPEAAASELLEALDENVENVWTCEKLAHGERLNTSTQITRLQQLPSRLIEEFNIWEAIEEMQKTSLSPRGSKSTFHPRREVPSSLSAPGRPTDSQSIFRERCAGGNQELPVSMPPTVPTINTDGSDTPITF